MTAYFVQAFIYLCAAVIAVPIAKRLGLGSVLGYLIAGVIIGPALGLVGQETVTIQHFAEFGVVMMLFLVGLELEPKALWAMKSRLIGLGGLQIALTTALVMGLSLAFGLQWSVALAIGLIFSLSSTAIVLQTFNEKSLTKTDGGRASFSVLLFQDIAVIPMLAFIPLLALPELMTEAASHATEGHHDDLSLMHHFPEWSHPLVVISAIAMVVGGGHFLSRPLFNYIAKSGLREMFTTTALLLVIGIAALMSLVGLSPALGTFLAGVVMANSEYRHELESDIEPFKGLLLGIFFITVGAGINFTVLSEQFSLVIGLTLGIMFIKAAVLMLLAIIFKVKFSDRWLLTLSLAQAGEFGFVLLSYSSQNHVLPADISQLLSLVVAISMFLTPVLFIVFEKIILPRYTAQKNEQQQDTIDEKGSVIIAGIGRFGQTMNRLLLANDINTIVLDHQVKQVDIMRSINVKSFYGDAMRPDILHSAGIEEASLLIVAIDNREQANALVHYAKHHYPDLKVLARAFDRGHFYELRNAGADSVIMETYYSALELGGRALQHLGVHPFKIEQLKNAFLTSEKQNDKQLYQSWKEKEESNQFTPHYRELFIQYEQILQEAMKKDRMDRHASNVRGWTPPPKDYTDDFDEDATSPSH